MVTVVSGAGLGLFGSSLAALGGAGAGGVGRGGERVYVNTANGNLLVQSQDEVLSALGLDVALIRTYNSQGLLNDDNGDNWRLGVHQRLYGLTGTLNTAGSTITKVFGDGREVVYRYDNARSMYVSTDGDGAHDTLSYDNAASQWSWTDGSARSVEIYDSAGRLTAALDADGNATTYIYDGALLTQINDASGQTTWLDYTGRNLTQIRVVSNGQTQTLSRYAYDGSDRLVQVSVDLSPQDNSITDTQVYTTTYTYDGASRRLASITQSDGSSVAFTYELINNEYRVRTYTDGEGRVTTLTYSQASGGGAPHSVAANGAVLSSSDTQTTTTTHALNGAALSAPSGGSGSVLQNFVTVTGVDAPAGGWTYYSLEVPSGMSELFVNLDAAAGSSGDAMLSVRRGAPPTTSAWDASSDRDYTGNRLKESVFIENPAAGLWYVGVYGLSTVQGAKLRAAYQSGSAQTLTLTPGQAISDLAGAEGSVRTFRFDIAPATSSLRLALSGLQDDGDLYLSYGAPVDLNNPHYAAEGSTANEVITVANPSAGVWYALVKAYSYLSDASLILHTNLGSNTPPSVQAGEAQRSTAGSTVSLSATASDAQGAVTYAWTQTAGPAVALNGAASANTSFTAPSVSVSTLLSFRVRVTDGQGASHTDLVHVTIDAPALGYTIPSGASWQSLANTLYGVDSAAAGSALQSALSNPPLTAGNRLTNLPATLTVTTTTTSTAPAYYTVQSGDTWASLTQTIYAVSEANAIAALQAALNHPTLATGLRLTAPMTLTYPSAGGAATLYLQTEVQDGLGRVTTYRKDSAARLTSVLSPGAGDARLERRYGYDGDGNLTSIVEDPNGLNRVTTLTYDANGNLLTTRDAAGNTVTRTYNPANQLLTETRYLVPDADGAGSGQPSAPLTARYVYDGEHHLRFVISGEGRVTEHQYNVAGQRTATLSYLAGSYDLSALTPTTPLSEAQLLSWRGSQALTRLARRDYAYDFRGNLSTLTAWAAATSAGAGSGTASITRFVYDQRGQLLQTLEARGSANTPNAATANLPYATTYTYDGLGRVLSTTQWNSGTSLTTTLNAYDDANRRTATTLANGLITTSLYNRSGELISLANGVSGASASLGATLYAYDAAGRLRIVTDASGVRQFFFYDEAGRKTCQVDGDGTLSEFIYNRASELIKTLQYAALIDSTTLATLADAQGNPTSVTLSTLRTAASGNASQDRITRSIYDAAGLLVFTVDESGALTQFFYDGAGRVTDEVRYATPVSIARAIDQVLPGSFTITPHADDRRTRHFYDADGKRLGTLDSAGYLVESQYDAGGRLFQQIAYANQTNASYWAAGTLEQLRTSAGLDNEIAIDPERDIASYFFYDAQGRKVGVLDGEGYLSETVYDVAGNVTQQIRYDSVCSYAAGATLASLRPSGVATRTTSYQYDGQGRLTQEINPEGTVTTYAYNRVGQLLSTTHAQGASEARSSEVRYDFLGRVIQQLNGEGSQQLLGLTDPAAINTVWERYGVSYVYDSAGRRITATTRPNDAQTNVTRYYYDPDHRLRFEINQLGERKEYRYNALNQLTDELQYTNRIALTDLNGGLLSAALITTLTAHPDAARDARTTYQYSLTGQLSSVRVAKTSSNALDGLTTTAYNAFGEQRERSESIDATRTLRHEYRYDRRGLRTTTIWDAVAGGFNTTEARSYDAFGRLSTLTDARLNVIKRYQYDRLGREIAHSDASTSDRTVTSWDAFSRTLTVQDALNHTTRYRYDDANRRMTVTTPENIEVVTTFNRHGQTLSVLAAGNTTTYAYNRDGQLTGVSDNLGVLESRSYDRRGRQVTQSDARDTLTTFTYDPANRVFTRTEDPVAGGLQRVTSTTYDGQGRVTRVDEPHGRRTDTSYYRDGRIEQLSIDPAGLNLRTRYSYDRAGQVITATEGYGSDHPKVTEYRYDVLGRRTHQIVDPGAGANPTTGLPYLNLTTQYRYDANGNLTRKIDARNFSSWYLYDADNRRTHSIDALGSVTHSSYHAEDQVTQTRRYATALPAATLSTLSAVDAPTAAQISLGHSAADRVSRSFYDRDGFERYTTDTLGTVTQRTFDANGNITRTRILANPQLTATYADAAAVTAALGAAATALDPSDRVQWSAYDARGQLIYAMDGAGAVLRSQRDAAGNVVATTAYATLRSTSLPTDLASLDAWAASAAIAAQVDNRTTRHWYDGANREVFKLDAEGYLIETRYDDAGRRTSTILYRDRPTIAAGAAAAQVRQNSVVANFSASRDQVSTSERDVAGRVIRIFDALSHGSASAYEEYGYDAVGNRISTVDPRGIELAERNSAWAQSERVRLGFVANATVLTAGERASLRARYTTTRSFDAAGRETTSVDPLGGVTRKAYDAVGNVVGLTDPRNHVGYRWYDAAGRVRFQVDPAGYVTERRYDALGNVSDEFSYARALTGSYNETTTTQALAALITPDAAHDRQLAREHDQAGRVLTITYPGAAPYTESFQYTVFGEKRAWQDRNGALFEYQYNARGELTRELLPAVEVVTAVLPEIASESLRLANVYAYNAFGERTLLQQAAGTAQQRETRTFYDHRGRPVRTELSRDRPT